MLVARLQMRCEDGGQGLDGRTVRDWEDRGHTPSAVYQDALCSYFQVDSIAELGLGHGLEAASNWTWTTPAERFREVQRRQLLRLTVNGFGASLLPVAPLTAAAQILGGRRRLDPVALDTARHIATHLATSYAVTPNQHVVLAAQSHAHTLLDLLSRASMTPDTRAKLTAIASDAVSLVGYGYLNTGRFAEADAWFANAATLARQVGDRRLEAFALAARAWAPIVRPDPDVSASIAAFEAAAELQLVLPPAGQAWLFAYLARERSAVGDDLGSGRLMERARINAARVPHEEAGWGWWSTHGELAGWDGARPDVFTGVRSQRLGRSAEAIEIFDVALNGTMRPIRRTNLQKHVMETCIALDEPERACSAAMAVLDGADAHGLDMFRHQVSWVRANFPREWRMLAPVIELDERLSTTSLSAP